MRLLSFSIFQKLRGRLLRNGIRQILQRSLRLTTILVSSLVIWVFVFAVGLAGFAAVQVQVPLTGEIVGTLFDLLFLALAVMLTFSSAIILYSSLFTSSEAAFLLSTPARADQVFAYKLQGAMAFSSWAFVLLGSPILIAYGIVYAPEHGSGVPWYFYALLPLYFLGFVLIPGCIGALLCLLIVNFAPHRRKQMLVLGLLVIVAIIGLVIFRTSRTMQQVNWDRNLTERVLGQVAFAQGPLVPSHWMARGIQSAARRDLTDSFFLLALVWSNGLLLYTATTWTAARLYRRGYNRLATGGERQRRVPGGAWMDRLVTASVAFLDPHTRLLILKDFRTFRRDPAQWAQIVIFTGLIVLYFTNVRRFFAEDIGWEYQNSISLLNLCATALLLCTYTGRFIYPMLSLEGRRFWILGLLPLRRERLLWGKFAFAATGSFVIAELLVLLSDAMLGMPWDGLAVHALTVGVLALGLSGLSVGLGACMPNFQETDPSKIAVGFGGTINLVIGLGYLVLVVSLMAGPWHLSATRNSMTLPTDWELAGVGVGLASGMVCGAIAVIVPLRLGARALRQMEF